MSDDYEHLRSKRCDPLLGRIVNAVLQNFEPIWNLVQKWDWLSRIINRYLINRACNTAPFRPHPLSTLADYASWSSLTDKTYLGLALAPRATPQTEPPVDKAAALFFRDGEARFCPKSTLLFPMFAQYLTDGFLRTVKSDRRRTTSNHDIDLSPLYGRTPEQTAALRLSSGAAGQKGRLKSQMIDGEEFPPFLFDADGKVKAEFAILDWPEDLPTDLKPEHYEAMQIFAVGGDRVNSSAIVGAMNVLLVREHNRLAGELETRNPGWDDERVFQTARNIVIAMYIKLVVEEYINHISSLCFKLKADPSVAWPAKWNKPNWMSVEFSLLYRWHSLVPETMTWADGEMPIEKLLFNNRPLTEVGLAQMFDWAGKTKAGRLGLHNTRPFLEYGLPGLPGGLQVESLAIRQNRARQLQGYNAYRRFMGMQPVDGFDCMTGDPKVQAELKALYGTPEAVDFYVGLFAEDPGINSPMPPLMGSMVALDAFSQALNNPLLSKQLFKPSTFSDYGWDVIQNTQTCWDILARNLGAKPVPGIGPQTVRMTRPDWRRRPVSV